MQVLVVAKVKGTDRYRSSLHRFDCRTVGLELLILGWHVATSEKNELGTEQTDPFGAAVERCCDIARFLDVGEQIDLDAIEGRCPRALEQFEF